MVLGALSRRGWCRQHGHAGVSTATPAFPSRRTCAGPSAPDAIPRAPPSFGQLAAAQSPPGAAGRRWSPRVPAASRVPSQAPNSPTCYVGPPGFDSGGGLLPGIHPLPSPHPRGSPCWCPKLSVGRAGRPPRPRGASEVAAVGPSLCGITPREESGCGNRVALAHSSNSRMSRAGEGGAGLSGTPLGPHSPEQAWALPGPSGRRAVTPKSPVSTALEFLATLGHGLT